eukprot:scaffold1690_cov366-Prasinococcus_capsulatus_cf.AAC.4
MSGALSWAASRDPFVAISSRCPFTRAWNNDKSECPEQRPDELGTTVKRPGSLSLVQACLSRTPSLRKTRRPTGEATSAVTQHKRKRGTKSTQLRFAMESLNTQTPM